MNNIKYLTKEASIIANLYNAKRYSEAITKSKKVINKFPDEILFYNILSLSLSAENNNEEAIVCLNKALNMQPNNIFVLNNLGLIYSNLHNFNKAEFYFEEALKRDPNFFDALLNYGNFFLKKNKHQSSIKFFQKAYDVAKNDNLKEIALFTLGNTYQQIGDFVNSTDIYKKLLEINPNYTKADKAISLVHKYTSSEDVHLKDMIQKAPNITVKEDFKTLAFALGKAFEDIREFDKSFHYITQANEIEKQQLNYNIDDDINFFLKIKNFFPKNKFSKISPPKKKMIFIVGMPRSGTTLTEQILSSHNDVHGAGELPYLSEFFNKELKKNNFFEIDNDQTSIQNLLLNCQSHYINKLDEHNISEKVIIDKAPLNFKWIGFILAAFPNAKIIHCQRDPIAVCWSNFKNSFSSKSIGFSYDLKDLGKYYNLYTDLINFWKNIHDNQIYNMDYQKLVTNKEIEIKKVVEYCDLTWDEKCLTPESNKKSVSTASLSQVRLPIYKSSIKNWENYSDKLIDLKKILGIF
tara:strand:+ start:1499 stop:3064 length:1566 start_codon:yes stop_codon:yes gene_type:complete